MNARAPKILLSALAGLLLAGCGGDGGGKSSSVVQPSPSPTTGTSESLQTVIGAPVSASETEVVIETDAGLRTFVVAPEDVASVAPGHINSHVGVQNLAFRIHYREVDGVEHALASEEVDLQTEAVGP